MCRIIIALLFVMFAAGAANDGKCFAIQPGYNAHKNLSYADRKENGSEMMDLDIYAPEKKGNIPVIVYIHGGGWYEGDKGGQEHKAEAFIKHGFLFVSVNYRLSPGVSHPAHVQDVAKAIAWTYKNARKYGGNPEKIYLMGHSSGAHLAALVAVDGMRLEAEGLKTSIIKGVILLDGAGYDIAKVKELRPKLFDQIYIQAFSRDPKGWKDASPITYIVKGGLFPRFLILHIEREVSRIESEMFYNALKEAGVITEIFKALDRTHRSLESELGKPGDAPTQRIFDFLSEGNQ